MDGPQSCNFHRVHAVKGTWFGHLATGLQLQWSQHPMVTWKQFATFTADFSQAKPMGKSAGGCKWQPHWSCIWQLYEIHLMSTSGTAVIQDVGTVMWHSALQLHHLAVEFLVPITIFNQELTVRGKALNYLSSAVLLKDFSYESIGKEEKKAG